MHFIEILKKSSALDAINTAKQHVPQCAADFCCGLKIRSVRGAKCQSPKPGITELLYHVYITRKEFGSMCGLEKLVLKLENMFNELILNIAAVIKRTSDEQALECDKLQSQCMGIRSPSPGKTDHCVIG